MDLDNSVLELSILIGRELFELPKKMEPLAVRIQYASAKMSLDKLYCVTTKGRSAWKEEIRISRGEMAQLFMRGESSSVRRALNFLVARIFQTEEEAAKAFVAMDSGDQTKELE